MTYSPGILTGKKHTTHAELHHVVNMTMAAGEFESSDLGSNKTRKQHHLDKTVQNTLHMSYAQTWMKDMSNTIIVKYIYQISSFTYPICLQYKNNTTQYISEASNITAALFDIKLPKRSRPKWKSLQWPDLSMGQRFAGKSASEIWDFQWIFPFDETRRFL